MNQVTSSLDVRFAELANDWRTRVVMHRMPAEGQFAMVRAECLQIKAAGRWMSGPADFLTIIRRHRDELLHSRMIGWLLNPTGRHGFGNAFLQELLGEVWPGETLFEGGPVQVELERMRVGESDEGEHVEARADLVIYLESVIIVIENKLDAGEQAAQCERLYWAWANDPMDVRWLYLTPTGTPPTSTSSPNARHAWKTASYAQIELVLSRVLDGAATVPSDIARSTTLQYLATLATSINR